MRIVSANALRAMLAQQTGEIFLTCLTINHSSFTQPYRFVNDGQALVRTGGTFQPSAFAVTVPAEEPGTIPQVTLTVDNTDLVLLAAVRTLGAERPIILMEVVTLRSPNTVEGTFNFNLMAVSYDEGTLTGTIGYEDDVLNTAFPSGSYTPQNSKGLFL